MKTIIRNCLIIIFLLCITSFTMIVSQKNNDSYGLKFNPEYDKIKHYNIEEKGEIEPLEDLSNILPEIPNQKADNSAYYVSAFLTSLKPFYKKINQKISYTDDMLCSPQYLINELSGKEEKVGIEIYKVLNHLAEKDCLPQSINQNNKDYIKYYSQYLDAFKIDMFGTIPLIDDYQREMSYEKASQKFEQTIKRLIDKNNPMPIVIGLIMPKSIDKFMELFNDKEKDYLIDSEDAQIIIDNENIESGLALIIVGYTNTLNGKSAGAWKIMNFFGKNWCDNGYFWLEYRAAELLIKEAYVIEPSKVSPILSDVKVSFVIRKRRETQEVLVDIYQNPVTKMYNLMAELELIDYKYKIRVKNNTEKDYYIHIVKIDEKGTVKEEFIENGSGDLLTQNNPLTFPYNDFKSGRNFLIVICIPKAQKDQKLKLKENIDISKINNFNDLKKHFNLSKDTIFMPIEYQ